jgi:hypothetical protein
VKTRCPSSERHVGPWLSLPDLCGDSSADGSSVGARLAMPCSGYVFLLVVTRACLPCICTTLLPDQRCLRPCCGLVLILTAEPGYPDADFLPAGSDKVREGQHVLTGMDVDWAEDGGITTLDLRQAVSAGANISVAWRAVLRDGTIAASIAALRAATGGARSLQGDDKAEGLLRRASGNTATGYVRVEAPCSYPGAGLFGPCAGMAARRL